MFGRVSSTAFGGGSMGAIRREIVRRNAWVDDDEYLELLSVAQLLPGSNPVNVAVLVGAKLRGVAGGIVALFATIVPGFAILMLLGVLALDTHAPWMRGALRGCAAVAVGLTLANAIEMTAKRINLAELSIVIAVALFVLVLHQSLALTLLVFLPIALLLVRPKSRAA